MDPVRVLTALLVLFVHTLAARADDSIGAGALQVIEDGKTVNACPLKHTQVHANIAGFIGRTTVRQTFTNPFDRKIEAIYVFPLPQHAAVDDMIMQIGDRRVLGYVREREEARLIYESAKNAGHVAALLDQERPNIFTQSVANIEPGATVEIEISYVETLNFEAGQYEWVFPMVVGPRYIPGGGSAPTPMTTGQSTPQVVDGDRITPPVTPRGTRAGHDIELTVTLSGGSVEMTPHDVASELHEIVVEPARCPGCVVVRLAKQNEIPNRDLVLRYRMGGDQIEDAFLVHRQADGAYFTLILQPPPRVAPESIPPRELIFVLDTSGSMSGFPIEKAKAVMGRLIGSMRPADTFNLITFAGETRILWKAPQPGAPQHIAEAQAFLSSQQGGGGTEMMKAIEAALAPTPKLSAHRRGDPDPRLVRPVAWKKAAEPAAEPIRIVCFMTDGYVGNDMEIIDAIRRHAKTTRVFSFGVGNSVNRYLLDGMAFAGRGEAEYVTLEGEGDGAVERFHERIDVPVLTDITIDWGGLDVDEVYPKQIPDLFSAKPVLVHGRLRGSSSGVITLRGNTGAGAYEEDIQIGASQAGGSQSYPAIASLWARAKIEDLMNRDLGKLQAGAFPPELREAIVSLGVTYHLMTQFTSFVAVEELTVTSDGAPLRTLVPVEMPAGVSYDGVFGDRISGQTAVTRIGYAETALAAPAPTGGRAAGIMIKEHDANELGQAPASPKMGRALQDLARREVIGLGNGSLTAGKLTIVDFKLDVTIRLTDLSAETLAKLEKLGFTLKAKASASSAVVGALDVRKLSELAALDEVLWIEPLTR